MRLAGATRWIAPLFAAAALCAAPAGAACRLTVPEGGDLQISLQNGRIIIPATVNGHTVKAAIDTGAQTSLIFLKTAESLRLRTEQVSGLTLGGAGGSTSVFVANVDLRVGGVAGRGQRIIVAGEHPFDVDMLLGLDFLSRMDVELDLAHGRMRLLQDQGCTEDEMGFWAQSFTDVPMQAAGGDDDHVIVPVALNGHRLNAILDTGAASSVVTLYAGQQAGVPLTLTASMEQGGGIGRHVFPVQTATAQTFTIGGETIQRPTLRFADLFSRTTYSEFGSRVSKPFDTLGDMLLGLDFVSAHHVLIAPRRHRVYFTYNGGAVFRRPAAVTSAPALPRP